MILRLIATGDLHASKSRPVYRTDDYWKTWQDKISFIVKETNRRKALLVLAGDLYDTPRVSPDVINILIELLSKVKKPVYAVEGQHDLKYRTDYDETPMHTLELAGVIQRIKGRFDNIFTGAGFELPIEKAGNRILVTHTCITPKKPPFFLTDAVSARSFLKKHSQYGMVISGDYHVPFTCSYKGSALINVGTIIRNKKDMVDYEPVIWYIELDTKASKQPYIEKITIPHKKFSEVFDVDKIKMNDNKGITIDTTTLKAMIKEGIQVSSLESIVWQLRKEFKKEGLHVSKKLINEVLDTI